MKITDLIKLRLVNQQIAATTFKTPHEIVSWLGAMQSQEYAMATWAIGLRLRHLSNADVEKAFNNGSILRTHLLRPTWHFVTPGDIRWMLNLTAPRVQLFNAPYYKKAELDKRIFKRCNEALIKALSVEKQLTRTAIKSTLEKVRIKADGLRLGLILMYAELESVVCSGPRQGKQFTYALLDERAPAAKAIPKEEALAKLTSLYFKSRGPATLQDFVWWSALTMKDAREGTNLIKDALTFENIQGRQYIYNGSNSPGRQKNVRDTFLMPDYDEYVISYKDRSAIFTNKQSNVESSIGNPLFRHVIIVDGVIAGTWKKIENKNTINVETSFLTALNKARQDQVSGAVKRFSSFFK